jgi:hypothetical protein
MGNLVATRWVEYRQGTFLSVTPLDV